MDLREYNNQLEAKARERIKEQIEYMLNGFAEEITDQIAPTTRCAFISQDNFVMQEDKDNEPLIKIWEADGVHDLETLAVFSLRKELMDAVDTGDEPLVNNIRDICVEVINIIDGRQIK